MYTSSANQKNTAPFPGNGINFRIKDSNYYLNAIRDAIEKGTGKTIIQLKSELGEDRLIYIALQHVITTKKAVCEVMGIPVEAACRYKRSAQKEGLLVESIDEVKCPVTKHSAHLLSTNPNEFDRLRQSKFKQLNLF